MRPRSSLICASLLAGTSACVAAYGADRPKIGLNRWQEDWSVLADPALRTQPLDDLKYIPLSSSDPNSYASLGVNLRERVESTQVGPFGIGNSRTNTYLIQRLEVHADIRPAAHWQIFVQLQDDRALSKDLITPADKDPLDLEQAFVTYSNELGGGQLKVRLGRQQMGFDLQARVRILQGGAHADVDHRAILPVLE